MKQKFEKIVKATGKPFSIEKTMGGYYRLMCNDDIIHDDSACEDVYNEGDALGFYSDFLLEYEVPEGKKEWRFGGWSLKEEIN